MLKKQAWITQTLQARFDLVKLRLQLTPLALDLLFLYLNAGDQ